MAQLNSGLTVALVNDASHLPREPDHRVHSQVERRESAERSPDAVALYCGVPRTHTSPAADAFNG